MLRQATHRAVNLVLLHPVLQRDIQPAGHAVLQSILQTAHAVPQSMIKRVLRAILRPVLQSLRQPLLLHAHLQPVLQSLLQPDPQPLLQKSYTVLWPIHRENHRAVSPTIRYTSIT
jgi:hypothetical protein